MERRHGGTRSRGRAIACALLLGSPLTSCLSAPTPAEVLATGFASPEQAFATFQTALRGDLVDLEYRSFSSGFKAAHQLSQVVYGEARAQLLEDEPFVKWVARAEIVERLDLSPDHVRLLARVDAFFVERSFHVDLVREDFWEAGDEKGTLESDYRAWHDLVRRERTADHSLLVVTIPMPEGVESVEEVTDLRVGREWKIHGFAPADAP